MKNWLAAVKLSGVGQFPGRTYSQELYGDTSHIENFYYVFGNLYHQLFTCLPENEFGFLHDAFEGFVVEHWKGLSLTCRAAYPSYSCTPVYMNPEQEIELVLRVLSTQPTDEVILRLEHEDVNPRKVEQEPEEKPEQEPEEEPEKEPEEKPEEEPEEEPVPLPVPVGSIQSTMTPQSLSFKKFRTNETTSSAPPTEWKIAAPALMDKCRPRAFIAASQSAASTTPFVTYSNMLMMKPASKPPSNTRAELIFPANLL